MCARKEIPDNVRRLRIDPEQAPPPIRWEALFGRPGPNAIEIGTGNGMFIAGEAARRPETNFIGIERDKEFFWKMAARVARADLANVRASDLDAAEFLERWIPEASVERIVCLFSDPWPKRRHGARRVITPGNLPLLERVLTAGGELRFKTDVGWYFNLAVTALRRRGGWSFVEIGRLAPPDAGAGEVMTNYERKARDAGERIWGFTARLDKILI